MLLDSFEMADARPERVCFVGDCQVGAFNGLLLRDPKRPGVNVLVTTHWSTWFRCEQFFENGRFSEYMTRLLWETRAARQTEHDALEIFTPYRFLAAGGEVREVGFASRAPGKQPALVVSCGVVDACDVDDEIYEHSIRSTGALPESFDPKMLADRITPRCAPLFAGLCALRDAGIARLFLLAVPPPSAIFERHDLKPAPLRRATRVAFNEIYARFCADEGIRFLQSWNELAPNGIRDERSFGDEHHLSVDGALVILNLLYRQL